MYAIWKTGYIGERYNRIAVVVRVSETIDIK